ncbi:unnamed protein product [Adineta steineri]|uniref:EGF-like domain-containing protein n=1 Tax=Adineta steineri TaxID=433720 RepID=A0A815CSW5_9BILA|nr:unnamed protein product [Adineta steineri]CAF1204544.1 unnamed protein product [Adineta steineri]CAF1288535.1 unnamed protein product [Adineta steineri]
MQFIFQFPTVPTIAACKNNGKCVSAAMTISDSSYTCICPDRYFGYKCQDLKARLNVSLIGIDIPAYAIGYFFTISNQSNPITMVKLQKLTLFQHSVIFYNDLTCFIDEAYICLCTNEHHANCMEFKHDRNFEFSLIVFYLLTASITSLIIMILFALKFWLLFLSYQLSLEQCGLQTILLLNCRIVEPLLKVILYIDKWLQTCVAIERIISLRHGINFISAITIIIITTYQRSTCQKDRTF